MIDVASIAWARFMRTRDLMTSPPPLIERAVTPDAPWAGASGDLTLSPGSPFSPRGPAVEAGRSANKSDPGDECQCPACRSDCAGIAPCEREDDQ